MIKFKDEKDATRILDLVRYANVHTQQPLTEDEIADGFPEGFEPSGGSGTGDDLAADADFPADFGSSLYPADDSAITGDQPEAEAFAAEDTLAMDEEDYASLEQELAGESLARGAGEADEDLLVTQVRAVIRDEMEAIRRELQEGLDHLRQDMLDRTGR